MDVEHVTGTAPAMMTIPEFCRDHRISKSFYYKLLASGQAPKPVKLRSRSLITAEAAAEWRRSLESEQSSRMAA